MGLCLFLNNVKGDEGVLGKCYGYNNSDTHLNSLDYLISINAFKGVEWTEEFGLPINKCTYDVIEPYFYTVIRTPTITLNKKQFNKFIELYVQDKKSVWDETKYPNIRFTFAAVPDLDYYELVWR